MTVSVRITVGKGERGVIGDGRIMLFRLIESTGSLRQAAIMMGMSYRNAWGILKHIESEVGGKMVESSRGGVDGGKSVLTPLAREMMDEYDEAKDKVDKALAGILLNAWVVLIIHDGRGSILTLKGKLPRSRITVDRPAPMALDEILGKLGIRGDRIRGPKVISDISDGSLNLIFQLDPEVNPLTGWVPRESISETDEEKVSLFIPKESADQDSNDDLDE
jgi:molybdate transport system regulatory protein